MSRTARVFGITANLSGSIGNGIIANSVKWSDSVETAEARDEKGQLLDLAAYSKSGEVSIDGLFVGSGVAVGEVVSIGGKNCLVTQSSHDETNTDFQTASVTAKYGDSGTTIHSLSSVQGTTTTGGGGN